MKIKLSTSLIGAMSVIVLAGCGSYNKAYDGYDVRAASQNSGSYATSSRYGVQEHCDITLVQCGWGVNWVAVPTYHQIIVPTIEETPIPADPEIYIPSPPVPLPTPEPLPEVIVPDPILPPIIQEDATPTYPQPPIYVPPPVIRK